MSSVEFSVIKWASEECQRQQSGEMSVYNMCGAWYVANSSWGNSIDIAQVKNVAEIIEPVKNAGGKYRQVPVTFRNGGSAHHHTIIPISMNTLFNNIPRDIEEIDYWYKEFETIHPFIDGNGRVGSILYNYFKGTLLNPIAPPDMWSYTATHF